MRFHSSGSFCSSYSAQHFPYRSTRRRPVDAERALLLAWTLARRLPMGRRCVCATHTQFAPSVHSFFELPKRSVVTIDFCRISKNISKKLRRHRLIDSRFALNGARWLAMLRSAEPCRAERHLNIGESKTKVVNKRIMNAAHKYYLLDGQRKKDGQKFHFSSNSS